MLLNDFSKLLDTEYINISTARHVHHATVLGMTSTYGHSSQNASIQGYSITHVITIISASQLLLLAYKKIDLAIRRQ